MNMQMYIVQVMQCGNIFPPMELIDRVCIYLCISRCLTTANEMKCVDRKADPRQIPNVNVVRVQCYQGNRPFMPWVFNFEGSTSECRS